MALSTLVFIDETWGTTNMTRLRGRAPVGERLVAEAPHGHWKTTTLICPGLPRHALRHGRGWCHQRGQIFESFVENVPVPRLAAGDVVVMDNLSSHKGMRVKTLIAAAGATVLYGPYQLLDSKALPGGLYSGSNG